MLNNIYTYLTSGSPAVPDNPTGHGEATNAENGMDNKK